MIKHGDIVVVQDDSTWCVKAKGTVAIANTTSDDTYPLQFELLFPIPKWDYPYFRLSPDQYVQLEVVGHINV